MDTLQEILLTREWKAVKFFPYTSSVTNRLLTQSHNYKTPEHNFLDNIGNKFKDEIEEKGIRWDNKIVIKIESVITAGGYNDIPSVLYIGCYDGLWNIGLGVYQDKWLADRNIDIK
jgi:hypothetical protein